MGVGEAPGYGLLATCLSWLFSFVKAIAPAHNGR
jgi:hypothetical protein